MRLHIGVTYNMTFINKNDEYYICHSTLYDMKFHILLRIFQVKKQEITFLTRNYMNISISNYLCSQCIE